MSILFQRTVYRFPPTILNTWYMRHDENTSGIQSCTTLALFPYLEILRVISEDPRLARSRKSESCISDELGTEQHARREQLVHVGPSH